MAALAIESSEVAAMRIDECILVYVEATTEVSVKCVRSMRSGVRLDLRLCL